MLQIGKYLFFKKKINLERNQFFELKKKTNLERNQFFELKKKSHLEREKYKKMIQSTKSSSHREFLEKKKFDDFLTLKNVKHILCR